MWMLLGMPQTADDMLFGSAENPWRHAQPTLNTFELRIIHIGRRGGRSEYYVRLGRALRAANTPGGDNPMGIQAYCLNNSVPRT